MATPLLTRDALALQRAVRPTWQRRLQAFAIPLAVVAVTVVHTVAAPASPCTDQAPCGPATLDYVAMGLLFAVAWAGPFDAMAAGWFAVAFLAVLVPAERVVASALVSPLWTYMVDAGLVAFCFAMARIGSWRGAPEAMMWSATTAHHPVPAAVATVASGIPTLGHRRRWLGVALVAGSVLLSGAVLWQQQQGEARQAAAERVPGVVVGHGEDGLTIVVRLDGQADDLSLPVLDAGQHPAGQRVDVYADGTGFVQLVSEPYDVTPWLALTVMFLGAGWALWRRQSRSATERSAFLATAAPVTSVYVRFGEDIAAVYAADARLGDPAVAVLHGPVRHAESGGGADPSPGSDPESVRPVAGVLYGVPVPGAWCVIEADGALLVPSRPASGGDHAPEFTEPLWGLGWDPTPGASPGPAHVAAGRELAPADRDLTATHSHQLGAGWAAAQAAAVPLVLFTVAAWLELSYVVWLGLVVILLGLAIALVARFVLPARIVWNSAGLAYSLAHRLLIRVGWGDVDRIDVKGMVVTIHIGDLELPLLAPTRRWLTGSRSAAELASALRYTRAHALDRAPAQDADLPDVVPRVPAVVPWLLCVLYAPVLAWALYAISAVA